MSNSGMAQRTGSSSQNNEQNNSSSMQNGGGSREVNNSNNNSSGMNPNNNIQSYQTRLQIALRREVANERSNSQPTLQLCVRDGQPGGRGVHESQLLHPERNISSNHALRVQSQQPIYENDILDEKDSIFGSDNLAVSTENIDFVKCAICMHIYINPIACGNCLNHFCTLCIREWLSRNTGSCPLCKNFREMRCVPMLKIMLDKLQFFCQNRDSGCEEIVRYEQVTKHEDACEYKLELCHISGCGEQMIRKAMEKHIQEECEFIMDQCKYCGLSMKRRLVQSHSETCEEKQVDCDLCGGTYKYKETLTHQSACPERMKECQWCSKEVKQLEIFDHQDTCMDRIVKCQGCSYESCLNEHFLHTKSCLEIIVLCPHCQSEMKRRDITSHTSENCIENVLRTCSAKIFQVESDNKELNKTIQYLKETQQINLNLENNNSQMFSQIYKDSDIFVPAEGKIALVREYKKKRRDRFVIADQNKRLLDTNHSITFKILSRKSEWYAIGICDESNVYASRRYHDIGHLSYLISANGILYSSHSPHENWETRPFRIDQNNIITVQFLCKQTSSSHGSNSNQIRANQSLNNHPNSNPHLNGTEMKLKFFNHTKNQGLIITLDPLQIETGRFFFCACLRCPGDSVEIISENAVQIIPENSQAENPSSQSVPLNNIHYGSSVANNSIGTNQASEILSSRVLNIPLRSTNPFRQLHIISRDSDDQDELNSEEEFYL